jgi:hypothetical protein
MAENNHSALKILSLAIIVTGLFLIGFSVTGNIVFGEYSQSSFCTSDIGCSDRKICCTPPGFNQKDSGVCSNPEECGLVKEGAGDETPRKKDYSPYLNFGISLILLAVVILEIVYSVEKKEKKEMKRRVKRKVKKRK